MQPVGALVEHRCAHEHFLAPAERRKGHPALSVMAVVVKPRMGATMSGPCWAGNTAWEQGAPMLEGLHSAEEKIEILASRAKLPVVQSR